MVQDERSPRSNRSRTALIEAMARLLERGEDASEVTITEIVAHAGVSRPTFYKYFDDVPTLVREAVRSRLKVIFDAIPDAAKGENWPDFVRGVFRGVLTDFVQHSRFYLGALDLAETEITNLFVIFLADHLLNQSPLGPLIRRRPGVDTPQQRANFLAAGTVWHALAWLRSDRATEAGVDTFIDEIAALLLSGAGASDEEITRASRGR